MISLEDDKYYSSESRTKNMCLDIRLSPVFAERLQSVRAVFLCFGALCLLVGIVFMILGAQPVLGFMGAEVVFLYIIFKYCEGNAGQREHVSLSEQHFIVRIIDRHGRLSLSRFDPRWVDLRMESHGPAAGLIVSSKGRICRFGNFLGSAERETVFDLLKSALRRAPGG